MSKSQRGGAGAMRRLLARTRRQCVVPDYRSSEARTIRYSRCGEFSHWLEPACARTVVAQGGDDVKQEAQRHSEEIDGLVQGLELRFCLDELVARQAPRARADWLVADLKRGVWGAGGAERAR